MKKKGIASFALALLGILAGPAAARPDSEDRGPSAPIRGVVVDSTGGALGGATVTLRVGSGVERTTVSDAAGRFVFHDVPAGPTTVTVTLDRFDAATLDVSSTQAELTVVLAPASRSEQVTVRAPRLTTDRITSATRTDTLLRDVPQAVTVVTRDLIADQSMQGMADVVRYVPGVGMAQGEGNRDAPILRGNGSTSDFFVDGVRDDVQYLRDLYNVERVEVLKGPNAMIFGRGGVGGVINRLVRQAAWASSSELTLQAGSWDNRRVAGDVGRALSPRVAARMTGLYENSDTYRQGVGVERYGLNPTLAVALGPRTTLRAGYEFFRDHRTADRGIPSFDGKPVVTDSSTFFGNAEASYSEVTVNAVVALLEHRFNGRFTLRNRLSYADYDKFYQNVFPGAVNAAATLVSLSAYNSGAQRQNLFNQTDLVFSQRTGRIEHKLLAGVELSRQETDNLRTTGFFSSLGVNVTTAVVPLDHPTTSLPMTFRPNAMDADNHGVARVAALYVQDQVVLSPHVQAVLGLRYDRFEVDFRNNRTALDIGSDDSLLSPRLGLVYKPVEPIAVYASYSLSYLPRAGEQLSSLSLTNQALEPEKFRNYELGAKWGIARGLALTIAAYRLDRGNVAVPDPTDPAVSILVDAQRVEGVEVGLSGNVTNAWSVAGAYAYQDGEITRSISATARAGATLAQLPKNTFSLWNKYDVSARWGVGLGLIYRGDMFTSTDNTIVLPGFTRVDAGVFFTLSRRLRVQANVENLFDESYYASAHSNSNIMPGSPRAVRVAVTGRF